MTPGAAAHRIFMLALAGEYDIGRELADPDGAECYRLAVSEPESRWITQFALAAAERLPRRVRGRRCERRTRRIGCRSSPRR